MTDDERMFWQMSAVAAMKAYIGFDPNTHDDRVAAGAFNNADSMLSEMRERLALIEAQEADPNLRHP